MFLFSVYAENVGVLGELFLTLGSLVVRNEFCEEVLSLGGVMLILQAFQNNIADKVCFAIRLFFRSIDFNGGGWGRFLTWLKVVRVDEYLSHRPSQEKINKGIFHSCKLFIPIVVSVT